MCKKQFERRLLIGVTVLIAQVFLLSQGPHGEGRALTDTTDLKVVVTGGDDAKVVRGATVYVEWQQDGETKSKEGRTSRQGIADPYRVARGKVFIQITGTDDWERKGGDFDLKEQNVTITISLVKKSRSVVS